MIVRYRNYNNLSNGHTIAVSTFRLFPIILKMMISFLLELLITINKHLTTILNNRIKYEILSNKIDELCGKETSSECPILSKHTVASVPAASTRTSSPPGSQTDNFSCINVLNANINHSYRKQAHSTHTLQSYTFYDKKATSCKSEIIWIMIAFRINSNYRAFYSLLFSLSHHSSAPGYSRGLYSAIQRLASEDLLLCYTLDDHIYKATINSHKMHSIGFSVVVSTHHCNEIGNIIYISMNADPSIASCFMIGYCVRSFYKSIDFGPISTKLVSITALDRILSKAVLTRGLKGFANFFVSLCLAGIEMAKGRNSTQQSVFTILNINKSQRGYRGNEITKWVTSPGSENN
ncbi:hypothetical protein AGLY_010249 [Aphis glycines]|uniref:Uncharacterized protein n=1 Tax=Aphis glycines TaxID=307491 RepID=A0A6G0TGS2_APHGL|nr:hypothetical protein AGLY_010249 [Aphis glycines]